MGLPTPVDHVALRALVKYLSAVHGIPYKLISSGTGFDESSVKNYANDKSSRSQRASEMYGAFAKRCSEIVLDRGEIHLDDYVMGILRHLFGDTWMQSANLKLPLVRHDHPLDGTLANWLSISADEIDEVEQRYRGLWTILRASSFPVSEDHASPIELREFNCSLLNIRPRAVRGGALCDFRWYHLGKGRERDEGRVLEGYVIPNIDRIEFLGRVTTRHKLLSLMVWRYSSNAELRAHAGVASGISLSLNTSGGPVGARFRAFFVENSDTAQGAEFEALKNSRLNEIGVMSTETAQSLIPPDQVAATMSYLGEYRPIIGYLPSKGNQSEE